MQATLASKLTFKGVGLHSGMPVCMDIYPAAADFGIWFRRVDINGLNNMVQASYKNVGAKPLCSELSNEDGISVSTVEHIMAALAGCGIHNALIELNGPEVPIMDGCSATFVRSIVACGMRRQNAPLKAIEVVAPVLVEDGGSVAMLTPARGLEIDFHIDFDDTIIGRQHLSLDMCNGTFVRELSDSRTFCRKADIDMMHENGLALGGTYENAVVVDGSKVLSPGGLRHENEAVRHKMLDALGDLALAGAPILGRYTGIRSGHAMTNRVLRALFADEKNYRYVNCDAAQLANLPGVGVRRTDLALVA